MASLDINEFYEELTVFFRNQNIISVADRGVTTQTDEFNGDTVEVDFQINRSNVKNVRSVTVGGAAQAFGTDYLVNYNDGNNKTTVTFTSAPASGTDNVDIQYDYGDDDKIYPDFPKDELTLSDFPRIGFGDVSERSVPGQVGAGTNLTENVISIVVYDIKKANIRTMKKALKDAILSNEISFFYVTELRYLGSGPLFPSPFAFGKNKVNQQNVDFIIPHEFEEA